MSIKKKIGVLAFHGDVSEHLKALSEGAKNLHIKIESIPVRTKLELAGLDALIIPGGESPTLQKLLEREGMWQDMKKIKNIFGTCAGAIMLAKNISPSVKGQKTLRLMDMEVGRNAYGRQADSFEKNIKTSLGSINAIFIRAPKILSAGKDVKILAKDDKEIVAVEQKRGDKYYLATAFHPELTTTKFHEYFLKQLA